MARIAGQLPNYYWMKFDIDYIRRREFMELTDSSAGMFIKLYLMAGESNNNGILTAVNNKDKYMNLKDITWYLRNKIDVVTAAVNELMESGLLQHPTDSETNQEIKEAYQITNFLEEQGPGEEEQRKKWLQYQRDFRDRKKREEQEQEEEKRSKKEEEKEKEEEEINTKIKIKRVNMTKAIVINDNSEQEENGSSNSSDSSLFSFFKEHLKDKYTHCFVPVGDSGFYIKPKEAEYWSQAAAEHGLEKLFAFWEWCSMNVKTGQDAYHMDKANHHVETWNLEAMNKDSELTYFANVPGNKETKPGYKEVWKDGQLYFEEVKNDNGNKPSHGMKVYE